MAAIGAGEYVPRKYSVVACPESRSIAMLTLGFQQACGSIQRHGDALFRNGVAIGDIKVVCAGIIHGVYLKVRLNVLNNVTNTG